MQSSLRLRAFVIHWHPEELPHKVRLVEDAGGDVVGSEAEDGARAGERIKALEPDALVIWLSRRPSHGRVTAAYVRTASWGHHVAPLFVDGDPDALPKAKVAEILAAVPGAIVVTPASLALWLAKVRVVAEKRRAAVKPPP